MLLLLTEVFAMPPAMVFVTCPPSKKAPRNSMTAAMSTADHIVRVLDPTLVPKAAGSGTAVERLSAKG